MVSSKAKNGSHSDDSRVSEQTWLNEQMSSAAKRITARLDGFLDVEATSTAHSELYQGFEIILNNLQTAHILYYAQGSNFYIY